ncbi:hypothetical protein ACQQ2N_19005 [Dokdonella sp. MW10]|uniref:hypothetical protein n=1 Tax=Dokdonella sp. MW10 TaxID=2992926 RepID=UPI003F815D1C
MVRTIVLFSISVSVGTFAAAAAVEDSSEECPLLRQAAEAHGFGTLEQGDRYYCEPHVRSKRFAVFALRVSKANPPTFVHSNLVGWYAVRLSDNAIVSWDIGNERPEEPEAGEE